MDGSAETSATLSIVLGAVMQGALVLYALLGGADYGGGVWDLFASGPRRRRQRDLIAHAIGPVWEANHVWLILVVVLLFVGFPPAFAAISNRLHVPLTVLLLAIVMRGAAFTFRTYDVARDATQERWSWVFSSASVAGPLLLGVMVGALAQGDLPESGHFHPAGPWWSAFSLSVGVLALALFAFLAAAYLTVEAGEDRELQEDFRVRALGAAAALGLAALLAFLLAGKAAPLVQHGLTRRWWSWPLHGVTAVCAVGAMVAIYRRQYRLGRLFAGGQAAFVVLGWGASQYPFIAVPDLTLFSAAAPVATQRLLCIALGCGMVFLFPSLYVLFRVFKAGRGPHGGAPLDSHTDQN